MLLSSNTTVSKVSDGTLADLTTGQDVVVTGTTNNDGTVTATRVQLGATFPAAGQGGPIPGDGGTQPAGTQGSTAPAAGGSSS